MAGKVREAYEKTVLQGKALELVSHKLDEVDLHCYLSLFDFDQLVTVKLINVGLVDQQLPVLLDYVGTGGVEILVLTGNRLSEAALGVFSGKSLPQVREIYLGKNPISKYRMKENINELKTKFVLYL